MTERKQNFIAGRWVDGARWLPNINPSDTTDVIAEYAQADSSQAADAIAAAAEAALAWATVSPQVRADVLDRAGEEVIARVDELGDLLAREEGKTLVEARGEAMRAGQISEVPRGTSPAKHRRDRRLDSARC